jgi:hypothetical protein
LSTAFKPHIKELRGAPLAVWLFISLSIDKSGKAFPGIRTMANQLGYSHQGVLDAIETLERKGYLGVLRGEKRYNIYQPEFAAIGRGKEPVNSLDSSDNESTFSPNESTFSPNESSPLDSNKRNKSNKNIANKKNLETIKAKADRKVDAILEQEAKTQEAAKTGKSWSLREKFSFNQDMLALADLAQAKFGSPSKKELSLWVGEIGGWCDFGCRAVDWPRACEIVSTFTTPVLSVTGMTKAMKAAYMERKGSQNAPRNPVEVDDKGFIKSW